MKHTRKRFFALLLSVCLLLSMGAMPVWASDEAETVDYSFDYAQALISAGSSLPSRGYFRWADGLEPVTDLYNAGTINSTPISTLYSVAGKVPTFNPGYIALSPAYVGDWVAIKFKSPATAGTYSVTIATNPNQYTAKSCGIYILPVSAASNIAGNLNDNTYIGEVNLQDSAQTAAGNITLKASTEYIVVFKALKNWNDNDSVEVGNNNTYAVIRLAGMTLSPLFSDVDAEVAAKNAVSTAAIAITETWVNPQNGHTYLYLIDKGGLLVVYDMNTKEIIDTEEDVTGHGRGTYVDAEGILWFVGNTRYLYRYDPYTLTCTKLQWSANIAPGMGSFSGLGVTGDEEGNIYFGTYDVPYLIKYDPDANTFTNLTGGQPIDPNVSYCGFGGMIVDGGFLYADIRGMQNAAGEPVKTNQIIKFDLEEREIVGRVDISSCFGNEDLYVKYLTMVDGVLIASTTDRFARTITVNAETMELINIEGMENGVYGYVSEPVGNKVYYFGYKDSNPNSKTRCLYEYDCTTNKATQMGIAYPSLLTTNAVVTFENNDGPSILMYKNSAETVNLYLCNLSTKQTVHYAEVIMGGGNRLREVITDPSGENIWLGAYGVNTLAQYNIASGTVTKQMASYDHQTDSLIWYDGNFYSSNYGACAITLLNVETGVNKPLYSLLSTAFNQERTFALTAGDGKVFGGTIPGKGRNGGVLVWYDLNEKLTYVAAGPNPQDVYYAETYDWDAGKLLSSYTWYNAATNQVVDFDDDNDGIEDDNITVGGNVQQRFYGLIDRQSIKEIVYQNGYIYGVTTLAGGSDATAPENTNAIIFVYDVDAMKVIETIDVSDYITGLPTPVSHIDALAADPNVEGKFWGVVCDTLFSFTFDAETGNVNIQEELSFGKSKYSGGSTWQGRDIVFDGDYMYVTFAASAKFTAMINKTNPDEYYIISSEVPDEMTLGGDGNLYFINFDSVDLMVLNIADQTAAIKDQAAAINGQALIEALATAETGDTVALSGNSAVEDLTVKSGVTLDLNGHTLTAASVNAFNGSNVKDSSTDATGLLKVAAGSLELPSSNEQLPLYDSANEGYRFYTATCKTWDPEGNDYWFRLTFSHSSAYDLIAKGDSGLKIGVKMTWNGNAEGIFAHPDASFYAGWADAVKDNDKVAIKVTVSGTGNVENFVLTPTFSGMNHE